MDASLLNSLLLKKSPASGNTRGWRLIIFLLAADALLCHWLKQTQRLMQVSREVLAAVAW
jgi:hypothetical protein